MPIQTKVDKKYHFSLSNQSNRLIFINFWSISEHV
jgi:hypothetical protein